MSNPWRERQSANCSSRSRRCAGQPLRPATRRLCKPSANWHHVLCPVPRPLRADLALADVSHVNRPQHPLAGARPVPVTVPQGPLDRLLADRSVARMRKAFRRYCRRWRRVRCDRRKSARLSRRRGSRCHSPPCATRLASWRRVRLPSRSVAAGLGATAAMVVKPQGLRLCEGMSISTLKAAFRSLKGCSTRASGTGIG
jgi:hypothetical protein